MVELSEIEELFKSEDFVKSKSAMQAVLRHATTLHNSDASQEEKAAAIENIKAITSGKKKMPKSPSADVPTKKKPRVDVEFPHDFHLHHTKSDGSPLTQEEFKGTWDKLNNSQRKATVQFHQNHLANKVKKSVSNLYDLFSELKKRL